MAANTVVQPPVTAPSAPTAGSSNANSVFHMPNPVAPLLNVLLQAIATQAATQAATDEESEYAASELDPDELDKMMKEYD